MKCVKTFATCSNIISVDRQVHPTFYISNFFNAIVISPLSTLIFNIEKCCHKVGKRRKILENVREPPGGGGGSFVMIYECLW